MLEAEAYRVGLSYTSGGLSYTSDQQFYPDHAVYDVRDGSSKQVGDCLLFFCRDDVMVCLQRVSDNR